MKDLVLVLCFKCDTNFRYFAESQHHKMPVSSGVSHHGLKTATDGSPCGLSEIIPDLGLVHMRINVPF